MSSMPAGPPYSNVTTLTKIANISNADMVTAYKFVIANPNQLTLTPGTDGNGQPYLQISWGSVAGCVAMSNLLKQLNVFQGP